MRQIAIFGVGGCGRGVMPLVRKQCEEINLPFNLVFVDDAQTINECNGHEVLTYDQWLSLPATSRHISLAVSNSQVRAKLAARCRADGVLFFEVRAPSVIEMDDVQIGEGAVLSPYVTLTSNICIGSHFHANLYSYVEHDCVIGDFVTFAPGVMCNGNVVIEDHSYIGAGAIIRQGQPGHPIVIGRGAVVGMGAVVTRSVPPGSTVVGNPARLLPKNRLLC